MSTGQVASSPVRPVGSGQVGHVQQAPDDPRKSAGEAESTGLYDGGVAADDRHHALAEIGERSESLAGREPLDLVADVPARLTATWGQLRVGMSASVRDRREVAYDEHLGVAGHAEVAVHQDPPLFQGESETLGPAGGLDAPCPDHGRGRYPFASADSDSVGIHLDDVGGEPPTPRERRVASTYWLRCGWNPGRSRGPRIA